MTIRVAARRFRCGNPACARRTFAERLEDVAAVSARRTERLGSLQRHVALALGGEAGARLAGRLSMPVSADTLLRMAAKSTWKSSLLAPRVLAVDDWTKLAKVPAAKPLECQRRASVVATVTEQS